MGYTAGAGIVYAAGDALWYADGDVPGVVGASAAWYAPRRAPPERVREPMPPVDGNGADRVDPDGREPFAGATVLRDLPRFAGDAGETRRVLARYAAVRVVLRALTGESWGERLRRERRVAEEYVVAAAERGDGERMALEALLRSAPPPQPRELCTALLQAGAAAAARDAPWGARSLYRTAYVLAELRGWPECGRRAVSALARLERDA